MRLNVYLQQAGVGSRREAERLVGQGRIAINGVAATATMPVNDGDVVTLDGKPVAPQTRSQPRLYLLHKPLDILVTERDPQGRPTVFDLPALKDAALPRLMYVGRLDVNSEGLLVFSSDGALAQTMMSPATALPRVYRVRVKGRLTEGQLTKLRRGVTVDGIVYRGIDIVEEDEKGGMVNAWYRVTLTEGKNREIRRLFEHYGSLVNRLVRTQYGPFALAGLKAGELREVQPAVVSRFIADLRQPA
jgi:23S rRNA pseudouridine2605 synthase